MIKPYKLKKGDTIAFYSPSSPHSAIFPKRLTRASDFLKSQGYEVILGETVLLNNERTSGSAEQRVNDLHRLFLDKKVSAIISTSGGLFCNDLLRKIDYNIISSNPKIFCGYSDNTLLSSAMHSQSNLVTFYGPCAIPELGEYPKPYEFTWNNFLSAVEGRLSKVPVFESGTDEFSDWFLKEEKARELQPKKGSEWLHTGIAKSQIIGGCLPSLEQLKGTPYDFKYEGKILFIEIPEGEVLGRGMPVERIDSKLSDIEMSGNLDKINGLIFGRLFRQSSDDEKRIKDIFYDRTNKLGIPVLYGVDITHSDPKLTIPIGVNVELNSYKDIFEINEQGVI